VKHDTTRSHGATGPARIPPGDDERTLRVNFAESEFRLDRPWASVQVSTGVDENRLQRIKVVVLEAEEQETRESSNDDFDVLVQSQTPTPLPQFVRHKYLHRVLEFLALFSRQVAIVPYRRSKARVP